MTLFYILIFIVVVIALIRVRKAPNRPTNRRKTSVLTGSRRVKRFGASEGGVWWFPGESGGSHEGNVVGDGFDGGSSDGGGGSSSDF